MDGERDISGARSFPETLRPGIIHPETEMFAGPGSLADRWRASVDGWIELLAETIDA